MAKWSVWGHDARMGTLRAAIFDAESATEALTKADAVGLKAGPHGVGPVVEDAAATPLPYATMDDDYGRLLAASRVLWPLALLGYLAGGLLTVGWLLGMPRWMRDGDVTWSEVPLYAGTNLAPAVILLIVAALAHAASGACVALRDLARAARPLDRPAAEPLGSRQ